MKTARRAYQRESTRYDRVMGTVFLAIAVFLAGYLVAWMMGIIIWVRDIVLFGFVAMALVLGVGGLFRIARGYPMLAPHRGRWRCIYRAALWAVALLFIGVQIAIGAGMASQTPDAACDYAVVLGARIVGRRPGLTLQTRLDAAVAYAKAHPDCRLVMCGGQGGDESYPEALVMMEYAVSQGIDERRILMDDASDNTFANLQNAQALIASPHASIMIVSSDYHLLRARHIAKRVGFLGEVHTLGAALPIRLRPLCHTREFLSVLREWVVPER